MRNIPMSRKQANAKAELIYSSGSLPIDQIRQSPGVLIEVQLQFAFFVDDQLRRGIELPRAFALVLIVEFEYAGSQIEGHRLTVRPGLAHANLAIGRKNNLSASWRGGHHDVGAIVA